MNLNSYNYIFYAIIYLKNMSIRVSFFYFFCYMTYYIIFKYNINDKKHPCKLNRFFDAKAVYLKEFYILDGPAEKNEQPV